MTLRRIRVERDTLATGAFSYAVSDERGMLLDSGIGQLGDSPVTGECELVLAADLVLLDRVRVAAAQRERLATRLRFLAEESAIPDPESLHVVAAPERGEVAPLAIVDRQWLAQLLARLKASALAPQRAYPESLLPPLAPDAWVVFWNGAQSFVRTGELDALALDEASEAGPPVTLRLALEKAREQGAAPQRIIVRGAPGVTAPDTAAWSAALSIDVEIGAAWRWLDPSPRPAIDLLQGEFATSRRVEGWQQSLRRVAIYAATLVVVASVGLALDWAAKARERKALLAEMQALYRETFGDDAVVVDPPRQMAMALAELRARSGESAPSDFLPLLAAASDDALQGGQRGQIEVLDYAKGKLTVAVRSADGKTRTFSVSAERGK